MKLVVHHPSVPAVVAHDLNVGSAHIDGHMLNGFGIPVVTQQFRCKSLLNRGIVTGRGEETPFGLQVRKYR